MSDARRILLGGAAPLCISVALVFLSAACSPSPVTKTDRDVTVLFDGFVYVGSRVRGTDATHSIGSSPLPSRFAPDQEYVFHHSLPVDVITMGTETLPSRLLTLRFVVTSGPDKDGRGIFLPSDGEPMYLLKAVKGACALEIEHRSDKRLAAAAMPWERDRWEYSDYILRLDGHCSL